MWHLFSSVDDGVDSELLQAKPFRYPDGGEVLRTDAAIYLRKIQMCGSIGDEMLCGFGGIASVPVCIVESEVAFLPDPDVFFAESMFPGIHHLRFAHDCEQCSEVFVSELPDYQSVGFHYDVMIVLQGGHMLCRRSDTADEI